ncbi:MAG: L-2-amino-thiazoline-4-carboxylic acid hydrolase [Desulfobacter sp.]
MTRNRNEENHSKEDPEIPVDRISETIGILTRREVEARILIPVIQALGDEFGRDAVIRTVGRAIINIAREQGRELAHRMGDNSATAFKNALALWTRDNALEMEIKTATPTSLCFDVTRCRYAEMYRALGAPDLGTVFSCNRDAALIRGFNPDAVMTRTRTIMDGDGVCDFKYMFPEKGREKDDPGAH